METGNIRIEKSSSETLWISAVVKPHRGRAQSLVSPKHSVVLISIHHIYFLERSRHEEELNDPSLQWSPDVGTQ